MLRLKRLFRILRSSPPTAWRVRRFVCPACGPSLLLRLADDEIQVRCLRCQASAITLSLLDVLKSEKPNWTGLRAWELSSRGPLLAALRRGGAETVCSEYFDGAVSGEVRHGIRHEDLQQPSFDDHSFDLITACEVFEHIEDDRRALHQACRVLRPGGLMLLTVPLNGQTDTVERTIRHGDGELQYLLPAQWHGDHLRGDRGVLVWRDYGRDLAQRALHAGFAQADWLQPTIDLYGWQRSVLRLRRGREDS